MRRQKKKNQKRKATVLHFRGYSISVIRRRGYNSLRSDSRPLPAPNGDSAYAPTVRPELFPLRKAGVVLLREAEAVLQSLRRELFFLMREAEAVQQPLRQKLFFCCVRQELFSNR